MNNIYVDKTDVQFRLWEEPGTRCLHKLGDTIDIRLRRFIPQPYEREIKYLKYLVEIVKSYVHDNEPVSPESLAILCVRFGIADSEIAMQLFKKDAYGQVHRLGLQPYYTNGKLEDAILTINGLLWDNRIIHVKDIAI